MSINYNVPPQPRPYPPMVGYHYLNPYDEVDILDLATHIKEEGYEFLLCPIRISSNGRGLETFIERLKEGQEAEIDDKGYFELDQLYIQTADYSGYVMGCSSLSFDQFSGLSALSYLKITQALIRELEWCVHIGLKSYQLPALVDKVNNEELVLIGQLVATIVKRFGLSIQLILPVTVDPNSSIVNGEVDDDMWLTWQAIKNASHHNPDLKLDLTLNYTAHQSELDMYRWFGEPIVQMTIPANRFITNATGYPVLGRNDQTALNLILKLSPKIIIQSPQWQTSLPLHPSKGNPSIDGYAHYVRHLYEKLPYTKLRSHRESAVGTEQGVEDSGLVDSFEAFANGYQDYLQAPLQPLMDHLESATYEVFEKDPIKYNLYEEAVYKALIDRNQQNRPTVIFVVGAGRGPLVQRCLIASQRANLPIKLEAVEKNPNAFVTLQYRKRNEWHDRVEIHFSDMRSFQPTEKADIVVSELLGSFGDNELSPECLDGAQRLIKDDGISIPCDYTSYLAPITASKLYTDLKAMNDPTKFDIPYVVMFCNIRLLAEPQKVWRFEHPNKGIKSDNSHNTRFSKLQFSSPARPAQLHGFAGYFEATLYSDIQLSIHPTTHSPEMFSWFPLFFPIHEPRLLNKDDLVDISIWRLGDDKKVWYEWSEDKGRIHNGGGSSYAIGL